MAGTRRKKKAVEEVLPDYDQEFDDRYTFCAHTEDEFTVKFKVPVGREGRRMTARLLPFFKHMGDFMNTRGGADKSQVIQFFDVAASLWQNESFDKEILPFVFGLETNDPRLEKVGLIDAFAAFMQGVTYILSGASDKGFQEAEKNSQEGDEAQE